MGRLVVALDGQAEDAGDPAPVLELVGDGRELRPEDGQREVLAADVAGAAPGGPCGLDRAFEVVDLGRRQLEPPAIRRFQLPAGPGEGAVQSVMVHSRSRCLGHLEHLRADYGQCLVPIHPTQPHEDHERLTRRIEIRRVSQAESPKSPIDGSIFAAAAGWTVRTGAVRARPIDRKFK